MIPGGFDLGPHRYEVDSSAATADLLHDEDNNGDSRPDRLLVRIDPRRPSSKVAEVLLHEAIHCAWHLTPLRCGPVAEHEEGVVTALAPLLLDLLRRNPDVVAFLTGVDR